MNTVQHVPEEHELLAKAARPAEEALRLHPFYRGKIQTMLKCPVRNIDDLAIWYTPGVAAPCRAIARDPSQVYQHTNKGNTIAIVTDGSRILGLGSIGPAAGLPVMEGKALLYKYLGGVDAVPICLATQDPAEVIETVQRLEPAFGGINLEDIAQPNCFRILDTLRRTMDIPVWHDDQQGSATVLLGALINALLLVNKSIDEVRIAMIGMGAANVATYQLLQHYGVDPAQIVACDSQGVLHKRRRDIEEQQEWFRDKWRVCLESNPDQISGGIAEALRDADVCIAFSKSGPDVIDPTWVCGMADDAIVFACANPVPEIWPWLAAEAGAAIVGTGRSDFPNQVNNSLGFPGIFRGVLDVRALTITDEMALSAAEALASYAQEQGLSPESILPQMSDWNVFVHLAVATGLKAQEVGVALESHTAHELYEQANATIRTARSSAELLMDYGMIRRYRNMETQCEASARNGDPSLILTR
jgi:malate dehydrogenase (oxaloacetate-decarboxylating)